MSTELEQINDHVERSLLLLIEQFKNAENLKTFISSFVEQGQSVEDMLIDLWESRWLDNAVGEQLDGLGDIVGQPRNNLEDNDYRVRIKVRIRINISSGLFDDIVDTFGILLNDVDPPISVGEYFPAGLIVNVNEVVDASPSVLANILSEVRAAGIDTQMVYVTSTDGAFQMSSSDAPETGSNTQGFADLVLSEPFGGGELAGVIQA